MRKTTYADLLKRLYNSGVCVFICMPVGMIGMIVGLLLQMIVIAFVAISLGTTPKRHEQLIVDSGDTASMNIITVCFDKPQDFLSDKLYIE